MAILMVFTASRVCQPLACVGLLGTPSGRAHHLPRRARFHGDNLAAGCDLHSTQVFHDPAKVVAILGADLATNIPDFFDDLVFPHRSILQ
jgi:hypothetical protein